MYPMPQLFDSEKLNAPWEIKPKISLEVEKRTDFTSEGSHNSLILLAYSEGSALVLLSIFFLGACNNISLLFRLALFHKTFTLY